MNAYVQASLTEKVRTTLVQEFGKDSRKTAVIVSTLYSLKSTGVAFRSHLVRCMEFLEYESCKADLDLRVKSESRPEDGVQCYLYLLCNVDNILCIHHNADTVLQWFYKSFPLKPGFGISDLCLGAKFCKTKLHNGVWTWAMSPAKYVQKAVGNCAAHLVANYDARLRLPKEAENPLKMSYIPKLDISPELKLHAVSLY